VCALGSLRMHLATDWSSRNRNIQVDWTDAFFRRTRRVLVSVDTFAVMFANNFSRSRRANGATQTFRRPSVAPTTTTTNSAHQRDGSASQPRTSTDSPGVYIPPHISASRNGTATEHRYSRDQLLQLFKSQPESENDDALSDLLIGAWEPNITNGNSSASWGRRDEPKDTHGADLCWDRGAQTVPLGLNGLTEGEKDVSWFSYTRNTAIDTTS